MTSLHPIYHGHTGEPSARYRPASQPLGYTTAKGTAGHYLASPEGTGGRFSLYRWDMSPASGGPGPHFHRTYDETFYILAGTVRLYDGTRWFDATPGDMLYVPGRRHPRLHQHLRRPGLHADAAHPRRRPRRLLQRTRRHRR